MKLARLRDQLRSVLTSWWAPVSRLLAGRGQSESLRNREKLTRTDWRKVIAATKNQPVAGSHFAEALYLSLRPDVAQAVAAGTFESGARHWVAYGWQEDLAGDSARHPDYLEARYLQQNPDVSAAVDAGVFPSGYSHFLLYGWAERRKGGITDDRPPVMQSPRTRPSAAESTKGPEWPLISVLVPSFETPEKWLRACLQSVCDQTYDKWELCVVDDASKSPVVRDILGEFAAKDSRINIRYLSQNGGISAASNVALAMASGSYVALLDHDDILTPDALYEIATAIRFDPLIDVIYSDEDKLSVDGRFYDFTHKPDWSPDLLRSTMYIGHLTCYRKEIVVAVGGFRSQFDGTQDYDLALRVTAITDRVHHIPRILYHWVAIPGSSAEVLSAKSYTIARQRRALEEDLQARAGLSKDEAARAITPSSPGYWHIGYPPPRPSPKVSIIIPTAGNSRKIYGQQVNLLLNAIHSLYSVDFYNNFEIIVVHNRDLDEDTRHRLMQFAHVKLFALQEPAFNFSRSINYGASKATGEYLLLLNDDIEAITPRFLHAMVGQAARPGVGAVGPRLLFADGRIQHVGVVLIDGAPAHALIGEHRLTKGPQHMALLVHNAIATTGACLLVRRDHFADVGGFDEEFPLNYNDVAFCLKLRERGLRIVIDPEIELYHFESLSKEGTFNWELQAFVRRWGFMADPYFNPNFRQTVFYEVAREEEPVSVTTQILQRISANRHRVVENDLRFSLILSVYKAPLRFLKELLQTINHQFYRNFELIIVNDGENTPDRQVFYDSLKDNPHIRIIYHAENRGIMGGYRTAFEASTGDYIVPVDQDDFLTLDALVEFAAFLQSRNRPAAVYSDEFKSNPQSQLFSPFHKPAFDPVLITNACYTTHLCAIRRDVAVAVGAYQDDRASWCHDWDTFTRIHRAGYPIEHLPELLYAWRINPGSTASLETGLKPETRISQQHVLAQHLELSGWGGKLRIRENPLYGHDGMWCLQPLAIKDRPKGTRVMSNEHAPPPLPSVALVIDSVGVKAADLAPRLDAILKSAAAIEPAWSVSITLRAATSDLPATLKACRLVNSATGTKIAVTDDPLWSCLADASTGAACVGYLDAAAEALMPDWLAEQAGLLDAIDDAVAIGGRITFQDGTDGWRGGLFGIGGGLASPDFGRKVTDSGYHGIGFCQHSTDAVPATQWLAKSPFLAHVLSRFAGQQIADDAEERLDAVPVWSLEPGAIGSLDIATAIAIAAGKEARVLYTPFAHWRLPPDRPYLPATKRPDGRAFVLPESRWYNRNLDSRLERAYQPVRTRQP